ncbi:DUF6382 domain-containing protein [Paenibacillus chibensis]
MVLSRAGGLRSDELSKVEVSMISASRIPHLLPLHVHEVDLQVTLRYDMTDKKMLSHMLKSERIHMTEYYGLLLQVAEALEQSVLYMLQPGKYMLAEDYIFVDGSLQEGKLYFTYVPLAEAEGWGTLNGRLKELVTRFMASVVELRGGGVQQLLLYTGSEEFTVNGFKKLLLKLLSGESGARPSTPASLREDKIPGPLRNQPEGSIPAGGHENNQMKPVSHAQQAEVRQFTFSGRTEREAHEAQATNSSNTLQKPGRNEYPASGFPMLGGNRDKRSRIEDDDDIQIPDFLKSRVSLEPIASELESAAEGGESATSSRKTYIALACLLGAAVVWRMVYMSSPSTGKLIICVILTLILAGIAAMSWAGKLFAAKNTADSTSFDALPDFGSSELSVEPKQGKGRSRFEVEQFTGFFRGSSKKGKGELSEVHDSNQEPDWKWKFPQTREDHTLAGIGEFQNIKDQIHERSDRGSRPRESDVLPDSGGPSRIQQRVMNFAGFNTEPPQPDGSVQDYYSQLGQKTEMLNSGKGGATVLLGQLDPEAKSASNFSTPVCYLLREAEDASKSERIELRQQHFVIGRSEEVSQYVESSVGASRAHVELSRTEDGGYLIKDLGSKNGTRLMGEAMVPYKDYPLHDGDRFVIVKGFYTFRSA